MWLTPLPRVTLLFGVMLVPVACAIAVFRYRLYDLDLVLNKAFFFGALLLIVTMAYSVITFVAGRSIGITGSSQTADALAMALVAS